MPLRLQTGVTEKDGRPVLVVPLVKYGEVVDTMFHMIRQNAAGKPSVLIRMIEVMTEVVGCERDPARTACIREHAQLVMQDGEREIGNPSDFADLRARYSRFLKMLGEGPLAQFRD
jgi:uncharacterized membrane protein